MLGSDVMLAQSARLFECKFNRLLSPRRELYLTHHCAISTTDKVFDFVTNLGQLQAKVSKGLRCDAFPLAHQPQKQMLRSDVVMVEAQRLFLG